MTDSTSVPLKHHMVKKCALLAVMALEALRTIYFMVKAEAIADQLLEGMPLHRNSEEARVRGGGEGAKGQKMLGGDLGAKNC